MHRDSLRDALRLGDRLNPPGLDRRSPDETWHRREPRVVADTSPRSVRARPLRPRIRAAALAGFPAGPS